MTRPTTLFKQRYFLFCALILAVVVLLWLELRESFPQYRWDAASIKPFKQWYQINWHNQAVGRASVELERTDDQISVIENDFLEGRVQGRRFHFRYIREFNFSNQPPYQLISGKLYTEEPKLEVEASFINDEQLQLEEWRNGKLYQKTLAAVDYTLQDYFYVSSYLERTPQPAKAFQTKILNTRDFVVESTDYELISAKPHQSSVTLQQRHPNEEVSWHQVAGDGSFKIHSFANGMEYVASSRRVTLNPEMQDDLYLNSGVMVDKPLGAANQIQSVTLSLLNGELDWFRHHPAVSVNRENETIQLSTGSQYKATDDELERIASVETKLNPIAKALALEATANMDNDWLKVQKLVGFVYDYLNYQPVPAGFNIDDILRSRVGDCTEYSQLLIEMLAAANIPAREVNGLVYLGDHEKRFGGHVWVEALVDGYWVAVDPTWNLVEVTSTHIPAAMSFDSRETEANARFAFKLEEIHYKAENSKESKRL